jgi:ERCC4-related helicase
MSEATLNLYPPGTLVQARKRLWRVDSQESNILRVTAVDAAEEQARIYLPFETVKPGQLSPPDPDIVGYPQAQDLMLRAFRLSMIHSTAPLLSLQRSRAIPVDYQLVPVVMALEQPRVRLLIADDIGLGKTIEAGLVITELMARGRARRLLVICPASLRQQWREALDYFFHLEAYIFSRQHRRALERDLPVGTNPLEFHSAFIVSVDYAKMPEIKNQILEVPWDIVVIDEAHQVAKPHQSGPDQRVKKDRWDLGKALAFSPKIKSLLMLTATPHNGYTDSFASLLELLDVEAVSGPEHDPLIQRAIAKGYVVQRRRKDVEAWLGNGDQDAAGDGRASAFPDRDQDEVVIQPSAQELEVIHGVQRYGELVLEHARSADTRIQTLAGWTVLHLHKRALSSPEALRQSLKNRRESLEQRLAGLTEPDVGLSSDSARANVLDEDPGELFDEEEIVQRSERVAPGSPESIQAELRALDELEALAKKVTVSRDSKLQHLLKNLLRQRLHHRPKVIIFTRYRDTMEYVAGQIEKASLYEKVKVITLHGSLNEVQRRERFREFEKASQAVLVATDAISEGINLQHVASQVIHYELPWNPNRLEQRNGRVDRFGQREPVVVIRTLVMDETLDATILKVLVEKANRIRHDYGFSPPYFGDEANILDLIQEHGLGLRLAPRQLGLFEQFEESEEPGELEDPFADEIVARIEGESFYGQTEVSLGEVQQQMQQVRETIGSSEEIKSFVLSGLNRMGCTVDHSDDGTLRIVLSHPDLRLPGLADEIPRATFDPKLGLDDPDVEVLDLGHPLVRRLMDLLKRETFQANEDQDHLGYGRTAVEISPDVGETTALYHLLVRFVTGGEPAQILEDLLAVAIPVYGERPLDEGQTRDLLNTHSAPETLTESESQEILAEALNRPDLQEKLGARIKNRQQELIGERQAMRQRLGEEVVWLKGSDEIKIGSWDLLSIKVLWPG